jgi:heat shock protein HslJ
MIRSLLVGCCALVVVLPSLASAVEYLNGIEWQEPPKVTPGQEDREAPSDAVVLFDGANLDAWRNGDSWKVEDGAAIVGSGPITTKQEFGDCQLHIEWSAPDPPSGDGQGAGNSGVFLMGLYEVQVLDSYSADTYHDGQAGAIYKQTPPAVNATRKPGEWNTYDIFWTAPRFDEAGELLSPAYITVVHNGVLILNHFELKGDTPFHRPPRYVAHPPTGPITLQDHGNPVRYRNIWIREFQPAEGKQAREPFLREDDKEFPVNEPSLEGKWIVTQVGDTRVATAGEVPSLTISAEGGVVGSTGVNRLMGQVVEGEKLFGPLATTRRAGPPEAMKLEAAFGKALAEADDYQVSEGELKLMADGEVVLVFEAAPGDAQ